MQVDQIVASDGVAGVAGEVELLGIPRNPVEDHPISRFILKHGKQGTLLVGWGEARVLQEKPVRRIPLAEVAEEVFPAPALWHGPSDLRHRPELRREATELQKIGIQVAGRMKHT